MDVRDSLREVIKHRGFIQSTIARKAGMTPSHLSNILLKKRKLEANEFMKICVAMEINPMDMWQ